MFFLVTEGERSGQIIWGASDCNELLLSIFGGFGGFGGLEGLQALPSLTLLHPQDRGVDGCC